MGIEDSYNSVFGQGSTVQFAPLSQRAGSPQGGAIPSHTFDAMDRKHMKRAQEILTFRDNVAMMKEREAARVQGNMAMRQISQLDPSQPDYLQKRNQIMSRYPKAGLDQTAQSFLGMQEDVYSEESRRRQYELERQNRFEDQVNQYERMAEREDQRAELQLAKERSREVMGMSSGAQTAYYTSIQSGDDPEAAYRRAVAFAESERETLEYLKSGGLEKDLYVTDPETGATRRRTQKEIAQQMGAFERQEREQGVKDARERDLEAQSDLVSDQIKQLVDQLSSDALLDMTAEERAAEVEQINKKVATLQQNLDSYRNQLADLRGLGSGTQGAVPSTAPTEEGGSTTTGTSSITGQRFVPQGSP